MQYSQALMKVQSQVPRELSPIQMHGCHKSTALRPSLCVSGRHYSGWEVGGRRKRSKQSGSAAPGAAWTRPACKGTGKGRRGSVTRPAQPGSAPLGRKSEAWDSHHSFSSLTPTCHPSASPQLQLQPQPSSNPSSPLTALLWPPLSTCHPKPQPQQVKSCQSQTSPRGVSLRPGLPPAPLLPTGPRSLCPSPGGSVPGWLLSPSRPQCEGHAGPSAPCSFLDSNLPPHVLIILLLVYLPLWNVSGELLWAELCAPQIPMLKP